MSIPAEWVYEHQRDKALEQVAELEARVAELEHENAKLRLDVMTRSWEEAEARKDEFAVSFFGGADFRALERSQALSLSHNDGFVMVTNHDRLVIETCDKRVPRRSARAIMTFEQFERIAGIVLAWKDK